MDIIIVLRNHHETSDLFLSKVIKITNFTGEYGELYFHLWMKTQTRVSPDISQSRSGCVIMRVSAEGGCSQCCWVWRWHSEGLQGCDLPPSHASHVNANTRTNCCCFLIIWPRINLCVCCTLGSIKASGDLSPMRVVGVCVCVKGVTL